MFERFTKDARSAVVEAQVAARQAKSGHVEPAHLLLGVIAVPGGTGCQTLVDAGVDLVRLTADLFDRGQPNEELGGLTAADVDALSSLGVDAADLVERLGVPAGGADARTRRSRWHSRGRDDATGHLRFTVGAKAALARSLREALELGDRHIGSEHVLLGVVAVDPDVRTVLALDDVSYEMLVGRVAAARATG
jgi:ATP-dependent Clp protease ATP-binding subunit ClpA